MSSDNDFSKKLLPKINAICEQGDNILRDIAKEDAFKEAVPFLDQWIKTHLQKRGVFMTDQERLSICWDAFEFCLHHYHNDRTISLANHFYKYTYFFILSWFTDQKKEEEKIDAGTNLAMINDESNLEECYEHIDGLKKFRDSLPKEYVPVFEDALMSMFGHNRDKTPYTRKNYPYGYYKYCESKKLLKVIIDFIIRE